MTDLGAPPGLRRFVKRQTRAGSGLPPAIQEVLAARAAARLTKRRRPDAPVPDAPAPDTSAPAVTGPPGPPGAG